MDIEQYLKESERTERKFPEGMRVDKVASTPMRQIGLVMQYESQIVDLMKKVLVYGFSASKMNDRATSLVEKIDSVGKNGVGVIGDLNLTPEQAELLHAALGIITEAHEIAAPIFDLVCLGTALDRDHIAEELGDLDWYRAILLRRLELDESQIRSRNIEKLRARYPDKFDAERAINRDVDAELHAMLNA